MSKKDEETMFTSDPPRELGALAARHGKKETVEHWATKKGMLPEMLPPPPAVKGQIPEAPRHNSKYGEYAAAKAGSIWPEGAEMTEAEFDAAVEKFYGPTNVMR